tara:strand:+ start:241 stop:2157 length:1917 start_codon:yes stop_codon:yes gene_type:complete
MATEWQTFPIEFKGGLVSNLTPLQQGIQAVGSATVLQNFEPSISGGYKKVLGYSKFNSDLIAGSGVMQGVAVTNNTTTTTAVVVRSGAFYEVTASSISSSALATGSTTSSTKVRFTHFNFDGTDRIMFVDGVNFPAHYSAGSVTFLSTSNTTGAGADVEDATHVVNFKNHLVYAKGRNIIFSAPLTHTDFTSANGAGTIDVGGTITGLIVFREQLMIFTASSISRLTGDHREAFSLQPVTGDIGCTEDDSIQEIGGDIMFLSPDGLRLLSATERIGDFNLNVPSNTIKNTFNNFITGNNNFHSLTLREKSQYRIFGYKSSTISTDSAAGILATKFSAQGSEGFQWATLKGFEVYCGDSRYLGANEVVLFANDDGYIYQMEKEGEVSINYRQSADDDDDDGIAASQSVGSATTMTINGALASGGAVSLNTPKFVSIKSAGDDSGRNFAVVGTTDGSTALTENITGSNEGTTISTNAFQTITSITTNGATAGAVTAGVVGKSSIDCIFVSPYMPINDPQQRKTFYKIALYIDPDGAFTTTSKIILDQNLPGAVQPPVISPTIQLSGTASVAIYGDENYLYTTSSSTSTTAPRYGSEMQREFSRQLVGSGRNLAISIEDSSTNPSFTLDTAVVEYAVNDRL